MEITRYAVIYVHAQSYALARHLIGLGRDLVTVGTALHGVGVRAAALLLGAARVCSCALQLVGVRAAPRAIEGRDAGAGSCPGTKPGHAGTGHWRQRRGVFSGLCLSLEGPELPLVQSIVGTILIQPRVNPLIL